MLCRFNSFNEIFSGSKLAKKSWLVCKPIFASFRAYIFTTNSTDGLPIISLSLFAITVLKAELIS